MSMKIEEVENLSFDEVKRQYNSHTINTCEGLAFWQTIYYIKKQDELNSNLKNINEQMLKYTKIMTLLTLIVLLATIANILIVIV